MTISAPEGHVFTVKSLPGSTGGVLSFGGTIFSAIGWTWSPNSTSLPTTVSFTDFTGDAWHEIDQGVDASEDGLALSFSGAVRWYYAPPTFSFSSIILEADLSVLADKGFEEAVYNPDLSTGFYYQPIIDGETEIDPGAAVQIELAAIPEPSTYAILCGAVAGVMVVLKRRRRVGA